MKAYIEFHPENGIAPHVVIVEPDGGGKLWFGYPIREWAEQKRTVLERVWTGRRCAPEHANQIVGS